jgi:hypothetical protein
LVESSYSKRNEAAGGCGREFSYLQLVGNVVKIHSNKIPIFTQRFGGRDHLLKMCRGRNLATHVVMLKQIRQFLPGGGVNQPFEVSESPDVNFDHFDAASEYIDFVVVWRFAGAVIDELLDENAWHYLSDNSYPAGTVIRLGDEFVRELIEWDGLGIRSDIIKFRQDLRTEATSTSRAGLICRLAASSGCGGQIITGGGFFR